MKTQSLFPVERIQRAIHLLRGGKVMLDADLAALYGVTTGNLNKAVQRNRDRFAAIRQLMAPTAPDLPAREMGFHIQEDAAPYRIRGNAPGTEPRPARPSRRTSTPRRR